jgi:hypothetical protein
VGIEVTSPLISVGLPNGQSAPIGLDPMPSRGRIELTIDLSTLAMSGPASLNSQIPANWWGYGIPLDLLPQGFDTGGKAPVSSAAPASPMTKCPIIL